MTLSSVRSQTRSIRKSSPFPKTACRYDTLRIPWQGIILTKKRGKPRTITSFTKTWTAKTKTTSLECSMGTDAVEGTVQSMYKKTLSSASFSFIVQTWTSGERSGRSVTSDRAYAERQRDEDDSAVILILPVLSLLSLSSSPFALALTFALSSTSTGPSESRQRPSHKPRNRR